MTGFRFICKSGQQWTTEQPGFSPTPFVECEYETSFWEGPVEAGQVGRRRTVKCADVWYPLKKRFLNTSPSVSYYESLRKAVA